MQTLRFSNTDEHTMLFISTHDQATLVYKGRRAKIRIREQHGKTCERYTAKARAMFPKPPDDGKTVASMLKAQTGAQRSTDLEMLDDAKL